MKRGRLALVVTVLMATMISCRSVKKTVSENREQRTSERELIAASRELTAETLFFGDALTGLIPIRMGELGGQPLVIPVESQGIMLELTLTDSSLGYSAEVRPVARSQLSYVERETEDRRRETEELTESSRETEKKTRALPWWIWGLAVLAALGYVLALLNKIKNPFRWLK